MSRGQLSTAVAHGLFQEGPKSREMKSPVQHPPPRPSERPSGARTLIAHRNGASSQALPKLRPPTSLARVRCSDAPRRCDALPISARHMCLLHAQLSQVSRARFRCRCQEDPIPISSQLSASSLT